MSIPTFIKKTGQLVPEMLMTVFNPGDSRRAVMKHVVGSWVLKNFETVYTGSPCSDPVLDHVPLAEVSLEDGSRNH
jgi:hypothetical protein